jgi:hypothetical protein
MPIISPNWSGQKLATGPCPNRHFRQDLDNAKQYGRE